MRITRKFYLAILSLPLLFSSLETCNAQTVILDQQPDTSITAIIDQEIPYVPELSSYILNDVTVDSPLLAEVATYFSNDLFEWPELVTEARLCFTQDPFNGDFDPRVDGHIVPVTVLVSDDSDVLTIRCDAPVPLAPGTNWIGLTPIVGFSPTTLFQEFRYSSATVSGFDSIARNPGDGFFGAFPDWSPATVLAAEFVDAAMTVSSIPMPLTPTFAWPQSLTINRGVLVAGVFVNVILDDDRSMNFNPGLRLNSDEAPVSLEFDGHWEFNLFGQQEISILSQAGTPGLTLTVEEWNWSTSSYEIVGAENESFNTYSAKKFPTSGHQSPSPDYGVRMRIGWRQTGFTLNFPWEVRIERVSWIRPSS